MSAIDRVKELLAGAEMECVGKAPCPSCDGRTKLEDAAILIAQALVESQEALLNIDLSDEATLDAADADEQVIVTRAAAVWREARGTLRLDGLAKAMRVS